MRYGKAALFSVKVIDTKTNQSATDVLLNRFLVFCSKKKMYFIYVSIVFVTASVVVAIMGQLLEASEW